MALAELTGARPPLAQEAALKAFVVIKISRNRGGAGLASWGAGLGK